MTSAPSDIQKETLQSVAEHQNNEIIGLVSWIVCSLFAVLDAWASRRYTDPDGISYLDMSDALTKQNWHLLINPHWSPLYPFLIGLAAWLTHPSAYFEIPLAHAINLAVFFCCFASFEFLMRRVVASSRSNTPNSGVATVSTAPAWIWQLLGYSIFAWSTFVLIGGLRRLTPDLCVATFVYLDAGLVLKLRAAPNKMFSSLLGLTLGLGYYAKAILFPMAAVVIVAAFFVIGSWRKALLPLAVTLSVFGAMAAPLFALISEDVGRPSFSESGRLNVVWQIHHEPMLPFYAAESDSKLVHPMQLLHAHPNVFAFAGGPSSTYSPWFNPSYWNAGADAAFELTAQAQTILRNAKALLADPYMTAIWGLIAAGFILLLFSKDVPHRLQYFRPTWPLLLIGAAGIVCYLLVLVLPRYIAPFLVLICLGVFPFVLVRRSVQPSKKLALVSLLAAGCLMAPTVMLLALHVFMPIPALRGNGGIHYRVAQSLNAAGLHPGEAVGIIGSGWDAMIWARMARVHVVAQIPPEDTNEFWSADTHMRSNVYDVFALEGATAIVTEQKPPDSGFEEWHRLADTSYFVHFLSPSVHSLVDRYPG